MKNIRSNNRLRVLTEALVTATLFAATGCAAEPAADDDAAPGVAHAASSEASNSSGNNPDVCMNEFLLLSAGLLLNVLCDFLVHVAETNFRDNGLVV